MVALSLMVVTAGCGASSIDVGQEPLLHVTAQDGFVFMTQTRVPSAAMEALFTGSVVADAEGCLRLASQGGAAVVWPLGYMLDTSVDTPRVLNDEGEVEGVLGGDFVLAGGEVDVLLDAMGFTTEDRAEAEACPGKYWIVNGDS